MHCVSYTAVCNGASLSRFPTLSKIKCGFQPLKYENLSNQDIFYLVMVLTITIYHGNMFENGSIGIIRIVILSATDSEIGIWRSESAVLKALYFKWSLFYGSKLNKLLNVWHSAVIYRSSMYVYYYHFISCSQAKDCLSFTCRWSCWFLEVPPQPAIHP